MDVAPGLAALMHELMDERQDRVADIVGLPAQEIEIERLEEQVRAIASAASAGITPQAASARARATSTSM